MILFIDEAHTIVGAGSTLGTPSDAGDILKPVLARQMEVLASRPEVALVGTGWRVVAAEGVVRRVVLPPETDAGSASAATTTASRRFTVRP